MTSEESDLAGVELTILMPCLNEALTVGTCVRKARMFLERAGIDGEVLVADNGSTDGSRELAAEAGAVVVPVRARGYGAALLGGIEAARGRYVIMGDADDSYDFTSLDDMVAELRGGADLVMGNRFKGGIDDGAMPPLHRYLGNPVLSFIGRLFFKTPIGDFHCGLRGFRRDSALSLGLQTTGMEFASELVVKSVLGDQTIREVPIRLHKDGRDRPPHLRSWRDGWRHLRFLLMFSPRWLFLVPGTVLAVIGLMATVALLLGPVDVGRATLDIGSLLYAIGVTLVGVLAVGFALITKLYAIEVGFLPPDPRIDRLAQRFRLEIGIVIGILLVAAGFVLALISFIRWGNVDFGELDARQQIRLVAPGVALFVLGTMAILGSFLLSILLLPRRHRDPA